MRYWLALAILTAQTVPAIAQQPWERERPVPSPITDRFHLRASYFAASLDTDFRLDPAVGIPGTPLNAEADLAMDERDHQGRIELMFRLLERNRLRIDYFNLDRTGDTILNRTVQFRDETFNIGERVSTSLDWRMLGGTYTYSAIRAKRFELGLGVGVHILEMEAQGEIQARDRREEASGVGAFPTVAVDATWQISEQFAVTARGQYFSASVEDIEGSLGDYHMDVQYRWRPNLAFGLGYSLLRAKLDVIEDDDFPGRLVLRARGPELFVRASF